MEMLHKTLLVAYVHVGTLKICEKQSNGSFSSPLAAEVVQEEDFGSQMPYLSADYNVSRK
jgi:hypothetical protein